jgi:hypothetical protein
MTRAQVGSDVEVLHESQATLTRPSFHQLAFGCPVGAIGQNGVDDHGESNVDEHVHGGLLEHASPFSAHMYARSVRVKTALKSVRRRIKNA